MGVSFRTTLGSVVALTGAVTFLSRSLNVLGDREADAAALANGLQKLGEGEESLRRLQQSADALGKATLFDQEDFDRGFALLTSFQRIGVDSYERVAKAAADVAQITGQDVKSALLQLSKALEDPARRVTDLSRSGTVFTEQQKEQIKALQESGRLLEAQNLVLREIEKQYGGAAEAAGSAGYAGAVDSLGESFRDFQERLATGVQPAVTEALGSLTDLFDVVSSIPKPVGMAALGVGVLTAAVYGLNAAILANPYVAAAAGIAALGAAAAIGTQKVQRYSEVVKITGNTTEELDKETKEVQAELKKFREQLDKGGRRAVNAKKKVKELEEALEKIEGRREIILDLKVDVPFPNFDVMGPGFQEELDKLLGRKKPATDEELKLQKQAEDRKFKAFAVEAEHINKMRDEEEARNAAEGAALGKRLQLGADLLDQADRQAELLQARVNGTEAEVLLKHKIAEINSRDLEPADKAALIAKEQQLHVLREQATALQELDSMYKSIGQSISTGIVDALSSAVDGTKALADVAADTLRNVANILLQFGVNTALGGIPGFDKFFGGARANGGTVGGGRSYLVGEKGPELFTPGRTGSIAPSGSFGETNVVVNVDASGTQAQGNQPNAKALGAAIGAAVQAELVKQKRPGGLLS